MKTKKQIQAKKTTRTLPRIIKSNEGNEPDSTYFLKLVLYVLLGTFWIKLATPMTWLGLPVNAFPVGMILGLILVKWFEKYQTDRKIWYAILVAVTIITYFTPAGVII